MIDIHADKPVLIAGPTASGKSALALHIAQQQGGIIVNADALQAYQGWPILSAQPSAEEQRLAPHALYGAVAYDGAFDLGDWIAAVTPYLTQGTRPIIVGGTGLFLSTLTSGLSPIPPIPDDIRQAGNIRDLAEMIAALDPETRDTLDLHNRMRVQRAWEVLTHTGHGMAYWHALPASPLLPAENATCIVLDAPKDWLTPRIAQRFDLMMDMGLLDEGRAMRPVWNPQHASSKTIGAADLIDHLDGKISANDLRETITIKTRQYAKRQRTWFRKRMADWHNLPISSTDLSTALRFLP
ncbi:tRNA (adenosine(37)-N6)-dimethylallyltransferase MiaA [Yoonia sp. 208BN28-4]|uniref:tRNA (adenosine(37)-N6)-dimethylallyltransferase MiaA n=1 Tax=Yoonia sp. 208BN28-4 TaxID=3126505 RepID=UPI00309E88E4